MQIYKNRRGITTVNKHLPFVWRVNYLHEAPLPETVPEIAHEKARPNFAEEPFSGGPAVLTIRATKTPKLTNNVPSTPESGH